MHLRRIFLTRRKKDGILLFDKPRKERQMRTVGIICEYNPFHRGHKHQIDTLRKMGYDRIVCVMSGNFTQRGELAMFDKYTRAKSAVLGGADIVLELPFPYCSLSAEGFATAGVHILSKIGVDAISFGSECADKDMLNSAAEAIISEEFVNKYTALQRSGAGGSAKCYFEALSSVLAKDVSLLSNDILAISYIAAIKRLGCRMDIVPIKREGLRYNDLELCNDQLPSASAIRSAIGKGLVEESLSAFVDPSAAEPLTNAIRSGIAPVGTNNIGDRILSFFKLLSANEICSRATMRSGGETVAEDGCGICERLCKSARANQDFGGFINSAYNAKYTDARINRVMLFALLGVSDSLCHALPSHTTLLASSNGGRELLSSWRKSCEFPIITKPADAPEGVLSGIGRAADELYVSAMPQKLDSDYFVKQKPYIEIK